MRRSVVLGFSILNESYPGVWEEQIVERRYLSEVKDVRIKNRSDEKVNSDIDWVTDISIIGDPFINDNFSKMKYVILQNEVKWSVSSIEFNRPRVTIRLGGELYDR